MARRAKAAAWPPHSKEEALSAGPGFGRGWQAGRRRERPPGARPGQAGGPGWPIVRGGRGGYNRRMSLATTPMPAALAPTLRRRLPNGLTVLMRPQRDVPVVTADVWIGTGSGGEGPAIGGLSHFLEHMLFKGTERFALGEIEHRIENVGGVCNAGTSYDFTHYYITLPSANLATATEILAEMMANATLEAEELEKERRVILEEYRRKQDDPEALQEEDLYEQLFETGPYHRAVIGTAATIEALSRAQMVDYYRRHYAPANMLLVLAGDFDADPALDLVASTFGPLNRPWDPILPEPEPTRLARAKTFHREKPTGGEVYYSLACGRAGRTSLESMVALDLAQYVLGQGRGSILYQEIKERRRLASTISCAYGEHRHACVFSVDATCAPEFKAPLRQAILAVLERYAREPMAEAALHRARRLLAAGHLFSFETTGSTAGQVGYYTLLTGGTEFLDTYLDRLQHVTAREVHAAFAELYEAAAWVEVAVGPTSGDGAAAVSPADRP